MRTDDDLTHRRGWAIARFSLGMMQMAAATVSAVLLFRTGLSKWALASTVATCALTTVSVMMFGARRPRRMIRRPARHSRT